MIDEIFKIHSKEIEKVEECLKNIEKIKIKPIPFTGKVGAVNSGFYTVRLGRMIFMRIKVRGILLSYKNNKLLNYERIGTGFEDLILYSDEDEE